MDFVDSLNENIVICSRCLHHKAKIGDICGTCFYRAKQRFFSARNRQERSMRHELDALESLASLSSFSSKHDQKLADMRKELDARNDAFCASIASFRRSAPSPINSPSTRRPSRKTTLATSAPTSTVYSAEEEIALAPSAKNTLSSVPVTAQLWATKKSTAQPQPLPKSSQLLPQPNSFQRPPPQPNSSQPPPLPNSSQPPPLPNNPQSQDQMDVERSASMPPSSNEPANWLSPEWIGWCEEFHPGLVEILFEEEPTNGNSLEWKYWHNRKYYRILEEEKKDPEPKDETLPQWKAWAPRQADRDKAKKYYSQLKPP